jgi:hypothetical protein
MSHPFRLMPGMRYSFIHRSQPEDYGPKGWATPKFMPGAFDGSVGKVVPLTYEGRQFGHGRVIAAKVADDGYSVEFTYEIVDLEPGQEGITEPGANSSQRL